MPATQRYQDTPSNASTDVPAKSPDENLESHMARRYGPAEPGHFECAGALGGQDEVCHRECHQQHGTWDFCTLARLLVVNRPTARLEGRHVT